MIDKIFNSTLLPAQPAQLSRCSVGFFEVNVKKICTQCGQEKLLSCFGKRHNRPIGYVSYCRKCDADKKTELRKDPEYMEKVRARQRKYYSKAENKERVSKYRNRPEIKEKLKLCERLRNLTLKERIKNKARKAVKYALSKGSLKRLPCSVCGSTDDIQAHHEDYLKLLEVVFLCRTHHMERHVEINNENRKKVK